MRNSRENEEIINKLQNKIKNCENCHWLGARCPKCNSMLETGFGWYGWYQYCPKCRIVYKLNDS